MIYVDDLTDDDVIMLDESRPGYSELLDILASIVHSPAWKDAAT